MSAPESRQGRKVVEKLVDAAKTQDPHALAELCVQFYPKVYRFVLPRVASREDAEDIAAEVCVRVVESLPKQKGFFPAWLFRVARNLVTDYHRRRGVRKEETLTDNLASSLSDPTSNTEGALIQHQLQRAVSGLTSEQQEVIRLKFIEGFDTAEIAAIQEKSIGAVRALQFRALRALREHISTEDGI
jgi:RNA polymerase sigma-70 factor (ECF subfamily)